MRAWALWRRLDAPGHDACRLDDDGTGWWLHGTAVYGDNGVPARLDYEVACSDTWVTRDGRVRGWLGARAVELAIRRSPAGAWTLNGVAVPGLDECVDLDLGFTPATNALQIRRVALGKGQAMDVPVAWLDVAESTLTLLRQRYERRSETTYWYQAPRFDYAALLEVTPAGQIAWQFGEQDGPTLGLAWIGSVQVLKSGNLLVCNWIGDAGGTGVHAFEITRDKKIVWKFDDHKNIKSATTVTALDD